jgi:hypothetical protein
MDSAEKPPSTTNCTVLDNPYRNASRGAQVDVWRAGPEAGMVFEGKAFFQAKSGGSSAESAWFARFHIPSWD